MDFDAAAILNAGEFTEGGGGIPASLVTSRWMNSLTREFINLIVAGGLTPDIDVNDQAITSISNLISTAVANLVNSSPAALDQLNELAAALGNDPNRATTVNNALALKADLSSPSLTGNPTAPTQSPGTNNTRIANTAFVTAAIAALSAVYAALSHSHAEADVAGLTDALAAKAGSAGFSEDTVAPGFFELPDDFGNWIVQGGLSGSITDQGTVAVTFPTTFPNQCFAPLCIPLATGPSHIGAVSSVSTSGFSIRHDDLTAGVSAAFYYIAVGR